MREKEEWNGFSIRLTVFIESYFTASIHDEVIFGVLWTLLLLLNHINSSHPHSLLGIDRFHSHT